jgi:hypothetical protein
MAERERRGENIPSIVQPSVLKGDAGESPQRYNWHGGILVPTYPIHQRYFSPRLTHLIRFDGFER